MLVGRWTKDSPWETCGLATDFEWKMIAEPVMSLYTEATDGSFIEHKESAMVWHHQEADPYFGSCQAKELLDHLESVLANEPVGVIRGQHIVEVKPQVYLNLGLNNGTYNVYCLLRKWFVLFRRDRQKEYSF